MEILKFVNTHLKRMSWKPRFTRIKCQLLRFLTSKLFLTLIKPGVFRHLRKPRGLNFSEVNTYKITRIKLNYKFNIPPPLFLRNYTADHPEIRYGSDHSDGLPIGSGTKYPELFRNYNFSGIFRKVRNFLNFRKFID